MVIADLDQRISSLYGMIHEPGAVNATVRCVFFIDPKMVVRAMIYYPLKDPDLKVTDWCFSKKAL